MSTITLEQAKQFLDVIHDEDDAKLQLLLNAAEDEACQFMGR
ncbi:MAG: head-tail connector protein [Shewanella sp.]